MVTHWSICGPGWCNEAQNDDWSGGAPHYFREGFPVGYSHYKEITVQDANLDADQVNFPTYVPVVADSDIGGHIQDTTYGYDIRIFDMYTDKEIPYEREAFAVATGDCDADFWVGTPFLFSSPSGRENKIRMYYGKSGDTDHENAEDVWDEFYLGVWHLNEGSGKAYDSTSNKRNFTGAGDVPDAKAGIVADGQEFDGTGDWFSLDSWSIQPTAAGYRTSGVTLSAWAKTTNTSNPKAIVCQGYGNHNWGNMGLYKAANYAYAVSIGTPGSSYRDATGTTLINTGAWFYICGVWDEANDLLRLYVDDTQEDTGTWADSDDFEADGGGQWQNFRIGGQDAATDRYPWDGTIDEVRFAKIARSAAWVKFEYYNINETDNELTWGSEVALGGGLSLVKIINETVQSAEGSLRPRVMARILNETEQVGEGTLRPRVMVRVKDEDENISETNSRVLGFVRVVADTLNISEDKLRILGFVRVVDEAVNIAEAKNYLKAMFRFGNDGVNIAEGTLRPRIMARVVDEDENIAEGTLRPRIMNRVVDEDEDISESATHRKSIVKLIADTLNLTEAKARVLGFVRIVDETLNISEGILKFKGIVKIITSVLNMSEGSLRPRIMKRVIDETEQLGESTLRPRVMKRVVDEDENIEETSVRARVMTRVVNSTVNIAEGIVDVLTYIGQLLVKVIDETVNLSEAKNKIRGFIRVVNETLNISESGLRYRDLIRIISDTLSLSEEVVRSRVMVRLQSDTVNLVESATKALGLVRIIAESLNILENIVRIRGIIKIVSDVLQISELINWVKTVPDAIKLIVSSVFRRVVSKTSARSDTVSAVSEFDKTVAETSEFQRVLRFKSKFETEEL